jgi:hypothetical protein
VVVAELGGISVFGRPEVCQPTGDAYVTNAGPN